MIWNTAARLTHNQGTSEQSTTEQVESADHGLKYRADIDGLRAVAVLGVLLFHAFPDTLPGGFWGVDVFFVISGFLISRIIWDDIWSDRFSAAGFYGRRIRRIFPALALVMLSTWVMAFNLLSWDELARVGKHMFSSSLFVMNFSLWGEGGYFDVAAERKPLLHLWSLSIEEQFYFVWPLAMWLIGKRSRLLAISLVVIGGTSFCASLLFANHGGDAAFYNPLGRAWELVLGSGVGYLAMFRPNLRQRVRYAAPLGLALIFLSFYFLGGERHFAPMLALVPTLGAALVLLSPPTTAGKKWLLQNKPMVGVGLISYPLYLWHWPLLSFAMMRNNIQPSTDERVYLLVGSFLLATMTYWLLERSVRKTIRKRFVTGALVVAIACLGALGWLTSYTNGFAPSALAQQQAHYVFDKTIWEKWKADVRAPGCHIMDEKVSSHSPACTDLTRPRVLLWGDSHAASLYPGLHALQEKRKFGIIELTTTGCPPLLDIKTPHPLCAKINESILGSISQMEPDVVILHAAWIHDRYSIGLKDIREQLVRVIDGIKAQAPRARVVVIGPELRWEPSLPGVLNKFIEENKRMPPKYVAPPVGFFSQEARKVEEPMRALVEERGGVYILPRDILCEGETCLTRLSDKQEDLLIFDYGHLTSVGSQYLLSRMAKDIFGN